MWSMGPLKQIQPESLLSQNRTVSSTPFLAWGAWEEPRGLYLWQAVGRGVGLLRGHRSAGPDLSCGEPSLGLALDGDAFP